MPIEVRMQVQGFVIRNAILHECTAITVELSMKFLSRSMYPLSRKWAFDLCSLCHTIYPCTLIPLNMIVHNLILKI